MYLFILLSYSVHADDEWLWGGHLKYERIATHYHENDFNTLYGPQTLQDNFLDFRLKAEKRWGAWDVQLHCELLARHGDTQKRQTALKNADFSSDTTLPHDDTRLLRLTADTTDDDFTAVYRFDRLTLGYSTEQWVVRVGRQAVSWGNGLLFQPLDIFSPFSPIAIDKDYKTGDDMLYGQWLFNDGNDLQLIALPRRDPVTGEVTAKQSSFAFKYHTSFHKWNVDSYIARHFDENVFGFGFEKDVFKTLWRLDFSLTDLKEKNPAFSLVTNMSYSWVTFNKDFYGYLEYFRNGIGETEPYLPSNLTLQTRLQRGELFTLGRDYLGGGLQVELTPLISLNTNLIINLHDNSGIWQLRGNYDWAENLQLMGGLNIPYGDRNTEFGELPLEGTELFSGRGRGVYVYLSYFF